MENKLFGRVKRGRVWSISLRALLTSVIGALVIISVGSTLFLSFRSNFENTFSLLNEQAIQLLNGMENAIRMETGRTEKAVLAISRLYTDGAIDLDEEATIQPVLRTLLLSEPSVEGVLIVDLEGRTTDLWRFPNGSISSMPGRAFSQVQIESMLAADLPEPGNAGWGKGMLIGKNAYHTVSAPLYRDAQLAGHAVAAIGRQSINRIISTIGRENETVAFVLTNDLQVLAHSRLPLSFKARPTIPLAEFPDPILRTITDADHEEVFANAASEGVIVLDTEGKDGTVFITKSLGGYAQAPYRLGAYFAKRDIGDEIFNAMLALVAALLALIFALVASVLIGRRLSLLLSAVTERTSSLARLEASDLSPMPTSRVREIREQAEALNTLQLAMREFARYVPEKLVERLLRSGSEATRTVEREVTIMFTDIVGFTAISERMNAGSTAETLNAHFGILCREIEARNGTVDKFMGDGLMAFWGAPDADPDHPSKALEAARSIITTVTAYNTERRENELPPLRIRIGIHVGRVVVGNIGGGSRQNYTIVGDAVNVAQRLEQLGKELDDGSADCITVVSGEVVARSTDKTLFRPAGTRVIRGREKPISVSTLEVQEAAANVIQFPETGSA